MTKFATDGGSLFQALGKFTTRYSAGIVAMWVLALVFSFLYAPKFSDVAENGEFAFLPEDSPSIEAQRLFREHFPDHTVFSNVVLVVRRETSDNGLREEDFGYINETLIPKLSQEFHLDRFTGEALPTPEGEEPSLVRKLQWHGTENVGPLYTSRDSKASLIVMELRTEFLDQDNEDLIERIEKQIEAWRRVAVRSKDEVPESAGEDSEKEVPEKDRATAINAIPPGLDITFSGTATYGRDAIREANESAESTERWTVILVVVLLLGMYRAPLLALVPLLTVAVATTLSLNLLAIGAKLGWIRLFTGIEPYVTVLVYGAGVDYCLFLIARYRELLDSGSSIEEAIGVAISKVGSALAASAGTTMCGIGMMSFAEFGKFQQAGIAISFGLFICLGTSLTLAPAVLKIFGRFAFWPNIPAREVGRSEWVAERSVLSRLMKLRILNAGWHSVGQLLLKKPKTLWLGSVLAMMPFSIAGLALYGYLSYGLLQDLPTSAESVRGARALQAHFPGGEGVPVRVLLDVPGKNYARITPKAPSDIEELTERILANKDELGIQAVRSIADPTGGRDLDIPRRFLRLRALKDYATQDNPSVTRMDLIFTNDAFSRSSIGEFRNMREKLPEMLPESMKDANLYFAGETAGLSDLKEVTDRDRTVINTLVAVVVFLILWVLLRRPWICAYLMATVLFSYFATLGLTNLFFWAMDPAGFAGLDWKVPMFLFTILIAVGEDYNIFLLTRIEEEVKEHGPINGIIVALERTGSIISSCGIIMAGTFSSLMAGSLVGMDQLGFALALGVILDTFVIRPVMVPSFLILLARYRERNAAK